MGALYQIMKHHLICKSAFQDFWVSKSLVYYFYNFFYIKNQQNKHTNAYLFFNYSSTKCKIPKQLFFPQKFLLKTHITHLNSKSLQTGHWFLTCFMHDFIWFLCKANLGRFPDLFILWPQIDVLTREIDFLGRLSRLDLIGTRVVFH